MKTIEELQNDFKEDQNELASDFFAILNKYYVKRLKAEQEIAKLQAENKEKPTPKK